MHGAFIEKIWRLSLHISHYYLPVFLNCLTDAELYQKRAEYVSLIVQSRVVGVFNKKQCIVLADLNY